MTLGVTFSQWQSVVAALPSKRATILYVLSSAGVNQAALVEDELACVLSDTPTEAAFLAAFPGSILVNGLSA